MTTFPRPVGTGLFTGRGDLLRCRLENVRRTGFPRVYGTVPGYERQRGQKNKEKSKLVGEEEREKGREGPAELDE